jgi:hypothetical protein
MNQPLPHPAKAVVSVAVSAVSPDEGQSLQFTGPARPEEIICPQHAN